MYCVEDASDPEDILANKLDNQPVVSVGIITTYYQPDIAREFWSKVATGDRLRSGDPRKALREFLLSAWISGGGTSRGKQQYPGQYISRACITAWNSHLRNEELKRIKDIDDHKEPVESIAGTLYPDIFKMD